MGRWGYLSTVIQAQQDAIAAERKGACPRQWYTPGRKAWPGKPSFWGEDGTPELILQAEKEWRTGSEGRDAERARVPRGVRADSRARPRHSWTLLSPWLLAGPCQGGAVWCGRKHTWFFQIQDTWVLGSTLRLTRHVNLSGHQFLHRQNAQVRWEDIYSPDTQTQSGLRETFCLVSPTSLRSYPVRHPSQSGFTSHTHSYLISLSLWFPMLFPLPITLFFPGIFHGFPLLPFILKSNTSSQQGACGYVFKVAFPPSHSSPTILICIPHGAYYLLKLFI